MASSERLTHLDLIDCAKANAQQGVAVAAYLCGYGQDVDTFQQALRDACHQIGVDITELSDLVTEQQNVRQAGGIEIAPDTASEL
jgi:hypothetical protein